MLVARGHACRRKESELGPRVPQVPLLAVDMARHIPCFCKLPYSIWGLGNLLGSSQASLLGCPGYWIKEGSLKRYVPLMRSGGMRLQQGQMLVQHRPLLSSFPWTLSDCLAIPDE